MRNHANSNVRSDSFAMEMFVEKRSAIPRASFWRFRCAMGCNLTGFAILSTLLTIVGPGCGNLLSNVAQNDQAAPALKFDNGVEAFSFEFNPATGEEAVDEIIAIDELEEAIDNQTQIDDALAVNQLVKTDSVSKIIGGDNRTQINNTAAYPWRAICYLESRWSDGRITTCSGALIGPRHVLTAAHCVYNSSARSWARSVTVVPGKSGTYEPYGRDSAYYYRVFSPGSGVAGDIALLSLRSRIGARVGWFGYRSVNDAFFTNAFLNTAGYPGDRGGSTMVATAGYSIRSRAGQVIHWLDTYFGQSGSSVWIQVGPNNRQIVAVHSAECRGSGCSENYAAALSQNVFNWISNARSHDGA